MFNWLTKTAILIIAMWYLNVSADAAFIGLVVWIAADHIVVELAKAVRR